LEEGKLPPQAPELEQAILGAILYNDDMGMAEVSDLLRPEVFYVHAHQLIYGAMDRIYARSMDIDILTVCEELKRSGHLDMVGGPFYISQLTNKVASSAHLQTHVLIVLQRFIARETIRLNNEAMVAAYGGQDVFDLNERTIANLEASIASSLKRRAISYAEAERDEMERQGKPMKATHTTGFVALDRVIGGYQRGDLIIIAGRPGMGKSSFALSSVLEACEAKHPTGLFSLELNAEKMQARIFSRRAGVPLGAIVRNDLTPQQIAKRHEQLSTAADLPLWIRYDSGISLEDIKAEATRMVRNNSIGCIVIDQLNWIKPPKSQNRDGEVGQITRYLKQIAMQLDIAVVLLHQLSRATDTRGGDKRPQLSDLRDSGNVEQDAQVVMFMYRPEYYAITEDETGSTYGKMEIIVAKNSNGPCETVNLHFTPETASVHERMTSFNEPPYNPRTGIVPHPDNRIDDDNSAPF
jgi:replicative DNA helicase